MKYLAVWCLSVSKNLFFQIIFCALTLFVLKCVLKEFPFVTMLIIRDWKLFQYLRLIVTQYNP